MSLVIMMLIVIMTMCYKLKLT